MSVRGDGVFGLGVVSPGSPCVSIRSGGNTAWVGVTSGGVGLGYRFSFSAFIVSTFLIKTRVTVISRTNNANTIRVLAL
jgi:hypothetical protein